MIVLNLSSDLDNSRTSESVCLFLAAGLHALLLFWNPTLLESHFKAIHDFVQVDVVDESMPAPAAVEVKKTSLMAALKDMLLKPRMEEIAHVAPEPVAPKVAAPIQPALRDKNMVRPMPSFKPTSQSEDLAAMNNPNMIKTPTKNATMPNTAPSMHEKHFGGIKSTDLPFQTGAADNSLAGGPNATVIPVAVGNRSAKAALDYSNPALKESGRHSMGTLNQRLGGAASDLTVAGGGNPAPIALSGTGGSGNAPTGASSGASLHNRDGAGGGSLVGRSMYGGTGGGISRGVQGIPSDAAALDQQIAETTANKTVKPGKKSFEIAGPINNRTITKKVIPQYPSWAEEQGIIGSVRIYFTVTPEGTVRSNMQVRKTTGYPELDKLALEALSQWTFAPVPGADEGSQWGIITFTFSLAS